MNRFWIFAFCAVFFFGATQDTEAKSEKKSKKKPATTQKVEPKLAVSEAEEEIPPEGVFSEEEIRDAQRPTRASDWPGYAQ